MSIELEYEYEITTECDFDIDELSELVVNKCLDYENCPYEACVAITVTNNRGIKRMNKKYRNTDKVTDVLSFPMADYQTPGDFSVFEGEGFADCFDPDTGELLLGDIVISLEKAKEQALEYGHSLRREFAFLIAHSMFHLMGYDHLEEAQRLDMENRQSIVLEELGITRA